MRWANVIIIGIFVLWNMIVMVEAQQSLTPQELICQKGERLVVEIINARDRGVSIDDAMKVVLPSVPTGTGDANHIQALKLYNTHVMFGAFLYSHPLLDVAITKTLIGLGCDYAIYHGRSQ